MTVGDSASGVSQPLTQHLQPLFTPVLSSPLSAAWPEGDYCCLVRQEQGESERVFVQCHTRRKKTWSRTWVQSSVPSPGLFLLHFVPGRKRDGSGEEGGRDTYCTFAVCYSASVSQPSHGPRTCPTDLQPPGRPSCCTLMPSWHLCQGRTPSGGSQLVTEPGRPCRDVKQDPFLGDLGPH